MQYGPQLISSEEIQKAKHRLPGETFEDAMERLSSVLSDSNGHRHECSDILLNQRFLPGGRVRLSIGSPRDVTPISCFMSGKIEDSFGGIMDGAKEGGLTMRMGGGMGYNFSSIRPSGERIKSQGTFASGPVSFMPIFNSTCGAVKSAGGRRGAQMGVLNVNHPDITEFILCKRNETDLQNFNISVGVFDSFMEALKSKGMYDLIWNGEVKDRIKAAALWEEIMRNTWDWAEPGVLFLDRINQMNNLWYCEYIEGTNPCGEQPLPPYGACLLGSFNLVQNIIPSISGSYSGGHFDYDKFKHYIPHVVRMMDNVIDQGPYPLPQQKAEMENKRRMGLGITGLANSLEAIGLPYASDGFLEEMSCILSTLRDESYRASIELAKEKGSFPMLDKEKYLQSGFIKTLPEDIQEGIHKHGIRNSHLLSIAPTGTISLSADNISSGLEPVGAWTGVRTVQKPEGPVELRVDDYGYRVFGVKGRLAEEIGTKEHVNVLITAQKYIDSACSKTCNIGDDVGWEEFKNVYMMAYEGGAKGCTTFRRSGKRFGIIHNTDDTKGKDNDKSSDELSKNCNYDPLTGAKDCGS